MPQTISQLLESGKKKQEKGSVEAAIKDYSKAIEMDQKNPEAYYLRGNAWFDLESFQNAVDDYSKLLAIQPDYKDAWFNRGNAYYELGKFELSVMDF
jgi:tetratricopeptide (TPR) repeat protein